MLSKILRRFSCVALFERRWPERDRRAGHAKPRHATPEQKRAEQLAANLYSCIAARCSRCPHHPPPQEKLALQVTQKPPDGSVEPPVHDPDEQRPTWRIEVWKSRHIGSWLNADNLGAVNLINPSPGEDEINFQSTASQYSRACCMFPTHRRIGTQGPTLAAQTAADGQRTRTTLAPTTAGVARWRWRTTTGALHPPPATNTAQENQYSAEYNQTWRPQCSEAPAAPCRSRNGSQSPYGGRGIQTDSCSG